MNKCKKCVWGTWLSPNMVYCMFPSCFKDKEVKEDAKETKEALKVSRMPRANRGELLQGTSKGN